MYVNQSFYLFFFYRVPCFLRASMSHDHAPDRRHFMILDRDLRRRIKFLVIQDELVCVDLLEKNVVSLCCFFFAGKRDVFNWSSSSCLFVWGVTTTAATPFLGSPPGVRVSHHQQAAPHGSGSRLDARARGAWRSGFVCTDLVHTGFCAKGSQCARIHVTTEGWSARRPWLVTLTFVPRGNDAPPVCECKSGQICFFCFAKRKKNISQLFALLTTQTAAHEDLIAHPSPCAHGTTLCSARRCGAQPLCPSCV